MTTQGGSNIIKLRGRSSFQSPAYQAVKMIEGAMGGEPFKWPAGCYVNAYGFKNVMMAMPTVIDKDGVHRRWLLCRLLTSTCRRCATRLSRWVSSLPLRSGQRTTQTCNQDFVIENGAFAESFCERPFFFIPLHHQTRKILID